MLDIIARSQRGRICKYSREESVLETPAMIRSCSGEPVHTVVRDGVRILTVMSTEVPLERGFLTTASSGVRAEPAVINGIAVVRLPLPERLEFDESVEMIVVPNAYELRKDPRMIVDVVIKLREAVGFGKLLCMMGIGEPSTVALLVYMGVDVFDDSLPRAAGLEGVLLMPEAEAEVSEDVSEENIRAMEAELSKVRIFIRANRLRELADQRSFASPSNVALLRLYD